MNFHGKVATQLPSPPTHRNLKQRFYVFRAKLYSSLFRLIQMFAAYSLAALTAIVTIVQCSLKVV